jgi:hypothetical protein
MNVKYLTLFHGNVRNHPPNDTVSHILCTSIYNVVFIQHQQNKKGKVLYFSGLPGGVVIYRRFGTANRSHFQWSRVLLDWLALDRLRVLYVSRIRIFANRLMASSYPPVRLTICSAVCLSFCPHVSLGLPPDGFRRNLIWRTFMEIHQEN